MPSRLLLFLYCLAHVHQEDHSSSLAKSRPLLKNELTNLPSVSSQHFGCHRHLHCNILVAIVIYIAIFWLPSSSTWQHFDCHHHLHRNILVAQVTSLLRTCYPSAHPRMCYPSARLNSSYEPAHCLLHPIRDRLATMAQLSDCGTVFLLM